MKTKLALLSFSLVLFASQLALACPGCKEAAAGASGGTGPLSTPGNMANGYGWSIVFMLGTVLTMIGGAVFFVYRLIRDEEKRQVAATAQR